MAQNSVKLIDQLEWTRKVIDRSYLEQLSKMELLPISDQCANLENINFYQIERIVYAADENRHQKILNLLGMLQTFGAKVILLVHGQKEFASLYIGVKCINGNVENAGEALEAGLKANFPGTVTQKADDLEKIYAAEYWDNPRLNVASVSVVPSRREADPEGMTRGLEKLIDTMLGKEYYCQMVFSPVSISQQLNQLRAYEQMASVLHPFVKTSVANGYNSGLSITDGVTDSVSESLTESLSVSTSKGGSYTSGSNDGFSATPLLGAFSMSYGSMSSTAQTTNIASSDSRSTGNVIQRGSNHAETQTYGNSYQVTIEQLNKSAEQLMDRLNLQIKRLENSQTFGLWTCSAWCISTEVSVTVTVASTVRSLMLGDRADTGLSYIHLFDNIKTRSAILDNLAYCEEPQFRLDDGNCVSTGSDISGEELSLFFLLPFHSVPGISVVEMAGFGRQVAGMHELLQDDAFLMLGNLHHMGNDTASEVRLDRNMLTSHCFICGTTGCGKSNTVYHMLDELSSSTDVPVPFLVIEPTKGEYRYQLQGLQGLNLFTGTPSAGEILRINPFRFPKGIHVLEHIDRLVEIFNTCWEMYAAMPAILKEGIEEAYRRKGWDLNRSICLFHSDPVFPDFRDLLSVLPRIISSSSYSSDTQSDYTGALVTRVHSLTNGIYGRIFCGGYDVGDERLFDERTIVDLSRIGSTETKSLLMGILVLRLTEYRMAAEAKPDAELKHVTILEEAHHILKNTRQTAGNNTTSGVIAKSVEMISNSIAEMRTYGEGFLIVDQSPGLIDESAVKNTNTKIIMRLPDRKDCECVGHALSLTPDQLNELSRLPRGIAAVKQGDWLESVLVHVPRAKKTSFEPSIPMGSRNDGNDDEMRSRFVTMVLAEFSPSEPIEPEKIDQFLASENVSRNLSKEINSHMQLIKGCNDASQRCAAFGNALIEICNCSELVKIANAQLELSEDRTEYTAQSELSWLRLFVSALDKYVALETDTVGALVHYVLFSKAYRSKAAADVHFCNQIAAMNKEDRA